MRRWWFALVAGLVAVAFAGCADEGGSGTGGKSASGPWSRPNWPGLPGNGGGGGSGGTGPWTLADEIRQEAREAGLGPLTEIAVPEPSNLAEFLREGPEARQAAIALGKALFWDTQVGSDGLACGSCHFAGGADTRSRNQVNPGTNAGDDRFGGEGLELAPNHALTAEDFPLRKYESPKDRRSLVLHETNDVVSSQGVFAGDWVGLSPDGRSEVGAWIEDRVFSSDGANVRRVEPRNTSTVINAVFNATNFWDGRAHFLFNGVSPFGPADANAGVFVVRKGALVKESVRIDHASLASQAVGPPVNDTEMSLAGRPFALIGKRLLAAQPLVSQIVHPEDSVLAERIAPGGRGLVGTYADLVREAFRPEWWESDARVLRDGGGLRVAPAGTPAADTLSQMEANFSLFFGLAIQMYEATLVSDQTPFDVFMQGDDEALPPNALVGLASFVGEGACVRCHAGAEFTNASVRMAGTSPVETLRMSGMRTSGALLIGEETAFLDHGYANIGVRPSWEDLGRGGLDEFGQPLSFVRQALGGFPFAPAQLACTPTADVPCPTGDRHAVDGAFKVPGLRNVELTGPFFHNGGSATLQQVVDFYVRAGDFADENLGEIDERLADVGIHDGDESALVTFLLALTDERVRNAEAPFDHPQIFVPNGHSGAPLDCARTDGAPYACDDLLEIPAVGARGRTAEGLEPHGTFLDLPHWSDEDIEGPQEEEPDDPGL